MTGLGQCFEALAIFTNLMERLWQKVWSVVCSWLLAAGSLLGRLPGQHLHAGILDQTNRHSILCFLFFSNALAEEIAITKLPSPLSRLCRPFAKAVCLKDSFVWQ